jgi:hypothetical protein
MRLPDDNNVQAAPYTEERTATKTEETSRRSFLGSVVLAGATLTASAITAPASGLHGFPEPSEALEAKIRRALLAGPAVLTKDATVAEMNPDGGLTILRKGTNKWVCFPGDENKIGDPPMCADPVAMQWFADAKARKPKPTNTVPGMAYMLCGATQRSNANPFDKTSPPIQIGPHWMILWPFEAAIYGLPTTVRDKGAWMMFADTPYAYLHICGSPWEGREYQAGEPAIWTMAYPKSE